MMILLIVMPILSFAIGAKDPITSDHIFPSNDHVESLQSPTSDTSSASSSVGSVGFITAPNSDIAGVMETEVSDLSIRNIPVGPITSDAAVVANDGGSLTKNFSFTAQTVVDNMDLEECVKQVRFTNSQYATFGASVSSIHKQVRQSREKLSGIDIVTHNILVEEANFSKELDRLDVLYNTLAVRLNALGKWMSDEKGIRGKLEELYREMVSKSSEEEISLDLLRTDTQAALTRLAEVQSQTSTVLSSVANAQIAMYDWAVNVTEAANNQTTKINGLTQNIQYRIQQIDTVIPAMRDMAKKTQFIAQSLGETNLAFAAANVLNHIQSVLNSVSVSDIIMTTPVSAAS